MAPAANQWRNSTVERRRAVDDRVFEIGAAGVAPVECIGQFAVQRQRAARQRPLVTQAGINGAVIGVPRGITSPQQHIALRVEPDRRHGPAGVVLRGERRLPRSRCPEHAQVDGMGLVPAAPDLATVDCVGDARPCIAEPPAPGIDGLAGEQQFAAFGQGRRRRDGDTVPAQFGRGSESGSYRLSKRVRRSR